MVLYTVIGEYDILYAQNRELKGLSADAEKPLPEAVLPTDLRKFPNVTALHNNYTNYRTKEENYNEYY